MKKTNFISFLAAITIGLIPLANAQSSIDSQEEGMLIIEELLENDNNNGVSHYIISDTGEQIDVTEEVETNSIENTSLLKSQLSPENTEMLEATSEPQLEGLEEVSIEE